MAKPKPRAPRVIALLLCGLLLIGVGCGGGASAPTSTTTLAPATAAAALSPPTPTTEPATPTHQPAATLEDGMLVNVGEHALWIRCWGEGAPTIVFDAPGPAADASALGALPDEVSAFSRVCIYDRAGQGRSDDGSPTPTTSAQQAAELATLLKHAEVAGPVVVAGYSWGGTIAYLFAAAHPDVTAGVVLIDAPHAEALAEIAATQQVIDNVDFAASAEELAAAPALGDTPLLVISRGLPAGPGSADFPAWQAGQASWPERSSKSSQVIATDSDHVDILETDLDTVLAAIEEFVAAVRGQ
jgi:pimeloyl-ACP methyl ester carboxylesterase